MMVQTKVFAPCLFESMKAAHKVCKLTIQHDVLQTVVTIHQNKEAEMSCILFWQYICSIVTLPCFMTLYLEIIEHVGV